jgi:cyclopropane fatty-acyl-phospholipid synthase-like methyltransferase
MGIVACGRPAEAPPAPAGPHGGHAHGFHHRFDDAAGWSKVFDDPARDAWQRPARVIEVMEISEGMVVADVGAGTGYFEPWLSRAVGATGSVLAVDVEASMVRWISDRAAKEGLGNVRAQVAAPGDPGLPVGAVDRVLVVDTWHHLGDRTGYARKLAASLTARGSVFIVDFTKQSPHGPPAHARLSPEEVVQELQAGGLSARVLADAGLPDQFVVVGYRIAGGR